MSSLDEQLEELYRKNWNRICARIPRGCGMSNPFLATVPANYNTAQTRLLVIGRETHGWCGEWNTHLSGDRVTQLLSHHRQFAQARRYRRTPFFDAATKLQRLLNPGSDPFDFMWLNLFICDQNKTQPTEHNAESLRQLSLLPEEIAIAKPDVVVFFTGPGSRDTIKHQNLFPDARFDPSSPITPNTFE